MKTLFTILFFGIVMTSQAQSIAESSSKFLSTYDFGKTNTVNNLIIINYNTIDVFKLQDYSVITNTNPASGIINNPNQNLFRVNTLNNLKQPNYVKQTIKQTTSKTTKIRYY